MHTHNVLHSEGCLQYKLSIGEFMLQLLRTRAKHCVVRNLLVQVEGVIHGVTDNLDPGSFRGLSHQTTTKEVASNKGLTVSSPVSRPKSCT